MKAARTSIFEPEVSYFIPAHVTTFSILSVLVACGRYIYLALLQPLPLSLHLFLHTVRCQNWTVEKAWEQGYMVVLERTEE